MAVWGVTRVMTQYATKAEAEAAATEIAKATGDTVGIWQRFEKAVPGTDPGPTVTLVAG